MQNRILLLVGAVVIFGLGVATGVMGVLWATGGNATPSRDTQDVVPTLDLNSSTTATELVTEAPSATEAVTEAPSATEAVTESASAERALYRISADSSQASFHMTEILGGVDTNVVGTTSLVAGDIIVDFSTPANSQVGEIAINARDLQTDNSFRNQAIRGRILESSRDEYEFIRFAPTQLIGLPTSAVAVGDTVTFQLQGNLTIKGTTQAVTFDVTVTVEENQLSGSASTVVRYADYGISIQAPPQVANISDEVRLELEFVAPRVEQ